MRIVYTEIKIAVAIAVTAIFVSAVRLSCLTASDEFGDEVVGHQPAADEFEYRAGHEPYKRPPTRLQRKAGILSVYQFKDNRPEERSQHDTPRSEEETNEQA